MAIIKVSDMTMKQTAEGFRLSFKEKIALAKLLDNLGVSGVDAVMLHTAGDIFTHGRAAVDALSSLIRSGYAKQVGISVYNADEVNEMLKYEYQMLCHLTF